MPGGDSQDKNQAPHNWQSVSIEGRAHDHEKNPRHVGVEMDAQGQRVGVEEEADPGQQSGVIWAASHGDDADDDERQQQVEQATREDSASGEAVELAPDDEAKWGQDFGVTSQFGD